MSRAERRRAEKRTDQQGRVRRLRRVMLGGVVVAVLAGAASAVVALTGGHDSGPSPSASAAGRSSADGAQFADPGLATAFMAAASSVIPAVTTYDYTRLDEALNAGTSVTTGGYRTAFRRALTGSLGATVRANRVVQEFQVLDVGVGEMSADGRQAKVLVFGRQVGTDRRSGDRSVVTLLTLCATLQHRGDRYLISDLSQDASAGLPPGTDQLAAAAEAARAEVVNVLSYSRGQFDTDLARAVAGAAEPLRTQLRRSAAATRAAMNKGGYDLTGLVTAVGVKSASGHVVTLLVAADSSRLTGGAASSASPGRYEVTVTDTSGRWLVAQIKTLTAG